MNRLQIYILGELNISKANNKLRSLTTKELKDRIPEKTTTDAIYRQVKSLVDEGYISEGVKVGKANSYYLTDLGIKAFEQIKQER